MVALSLFFTLFFTLQSATALRRAVIRQQDCDSQCAAFNSQSNTCNQTVVQNAATCYDCMIQIGQYSQANAQETLNEFVQDCDDLGTPVTNITLSAAGAKGTPAATNTAATTKPTETGGEDTTDAGAEPTDAAGDPVQSANASGSASAAAPGNTTSGAVEALAETLPCKATSICFGVIHVDEFEVSDVSEQGLRGVDGDEQQRLNVNRKILDALEGTPRLQMPSCGPGMHRANR
ncbi:hypothetical protein B0H13DRAFT_2319955 [Mycena leptocephala]|nr:hypothetical protein B0H13DRAFT_2354011 [Mycena leptocephala]KAJ7919846.1 hypothetical protein B0H13DRAFT_2319955 [Mycena leptocephala]